MKTAGEILETKGGLIVTVSPDTTVHDALRKMIKNKIGAIVIEDKGKMIGIWTERDLKQYSQ